MDSCVKPEDSVPAEHRQPWQTPVLQKAGVDEVTRSSTGLSNEGGGASTPT